MRSELQKESYMSDLLKDVKFNVQHVVQRVETDDHILIVKTYANSGLLVHFMEYWTFAKIK
jgi:hypothetical protein